MPISETPILDERAVSEIEARANVATKGPWRQSALAGMYIVADGADAATVASVGEYNTDGSIHLAFDKAPENLEFIAHARDDILDLCRAVKHLQASVDRFSTLADERHDLLSAERRANDDLRAERSRILPALERAQQERNRLGTGLANLYHVITGKTCDKHVALGMATSAVSSLQSQLEQLRAENERLAGQLKDWQEKKDTKAGYL